MKEFPDGKVAEPEKHAGKAGKIFRIVARVSGYLFLTVFLFVIAGYNYVMRPAFLEPLIVKQFAENTNGKIEIKIDQASLFRGFKLRNVVVYPPAGFNKTPILKAILISIPFLKTWKYTGEGHSISIRLPKKNSAIFTCSATPKFST